MKKYVKYFGCLIMASISIGLFEFMVLMVSIDWWLGVKFKGWGDYAMMLSLLAIIGTVLMSLGVCMIIEGRRQYLNQ